MFCLRHGYHYDGAKWTFAHLKWLKKLELSALSLVVETGDCSRFAQGNVYAAYFGLALGELSSAEKINRLGITKSGNSHLRLLLVEAAGGICKGAVGHKSKELRQRQQGNSSEVLSYADKSNARMRSKYYHLIRHGKKRNIAVAAIARELACFVWGMVTGNIEEKAACCGIEYLANDDRHSVYVEELEDYVNKPYWCASSVVHNGTDYYTVGTDEELEGLTVRYK